MPNIVIIGNSAAGYAACETLVKNSSSPAAITVISEEPYPAYKRNLLLEYLRGGVREDGLFLCNGDFYKNNNISFRSSAMVARLDTRKRKVILKDNAKVDYDWLIIASGRKIELPDIPGKTKDGVMAFYNLDDAKQVREKIMIAQTVCVIGQNQISTRLAEAIRLKDKEVKIISRLGPAVMDQAQDQALELISGVEPAECIGEGEVQALKLSNGKVIGTSLVLFTDGYKPETDFLKETDVQTSEGYIIVDDMARTNLENIFAAGSVSRKADTQVMDKTWEICEREGILAAQSIINSI